jgi:WD40 repeat protein
MLLRARAFQVTFQNTSTIEGDTHVWCSVLDLTLTPCHKYVLMCTDQSKNVLMPFNGPSKHVRTFYGAVSDQVCLSCILLIRVVRVTGGEQLSTPRATWSPDGRNLYCTSQDHSVLVWDVSNQAVLNRLKGHTKNVRGIDHHHTRPLLASCGFDRKMMMWE